MRCRLLSIACLLSLALFVATVRLWVRSGETADWITYEKRPRRSTRIGTAAPHCFRPADG